MAAVHVLEKRGHTYRVIVHKTMPAGNNSAGQSWKNIILATGKNVTAMTEGTLPGQITTAEKTTITAGDVIEAELEVALFSGGNSVAQINALVDAAYNSWAGQMQDTYKWWGQTQA